MAAYPAGGEAGEYSEDGGKKKCAYVRTGPRPEIAAKNSRSDRRHVIYRHTGIERRGDVGLFFRYASEIAYARRARREKKIVDDEAYRNYD